MKVLSTFVFKVVALGVTSFACKMNPLAKYTKQYKCTIEGEAEPRTSKDFVKRGNKHLVIDFKH